MVTREDLLTALCIGVHVAKVDRNFVESEKRILGELADLIKLTDDEKERLVNREATLAEMIDRLSSTESIVLMIKTVCLIAYVDGKVVDVELDFVNKMLEKIESEFRLKPSEEWVSYATDVRGAVMYYRR